MMKSRITLSALALLSLATAAQAGQSDTASDLSKLASKTLQVDGITDARIVEIVETNPPFSPFVFTYCRKGSPSLWRYEVISSDGPDSRHGSRVAKSQAVESDSKSCKVAS